MSDDTSASGADEREEDAFSRAFRERWGSLGHDTAPVLRPDPTSPLPMTDTARLPAQSASAPWPPSVALPPSADPSAPLPPSADPAGPPPPSSAYAGPAHPQRVEPGTAYGRDPAVPQPGQPYPTYGQETDHHPSPSAAALVIVSVLTMVFTFLFIGVPSAVMGLIASGRQDPAAKRRLLRFGWIVYAVNWAFVVLGMVLLGVGLVVWLDQITSPGR